MKLIGDPHFGRVFNGTPLNRRGEREAMQLAQFSEELNCGDHLVVMVGDLFDRPFVPLPIIHDVINAVLYAAENNASTTYVMMAGNHDKSRQLDTRAAWEVFRLAVHDHVIVLDEPWQYQGYAFFPWQWGVPALDQLDAIEGPIHTAIGHWDLQSFGGDDSHMAPTRALVEKFGPIEIHSGHYHTTGDYEVDGITVHCTGSMQPYSHAEDPSGEMYVTLTVDEALNRDDLRDKCVRLILEPSEEVPLIDCLQLTHQRQRETIEIEVNLGEFSLAQTLDEEFSDKCVPEGVQTFIKERLVAAA